QGADACYVQADRFAEEQWEEQVGLVAEDQPGQAPAGVRLGRGECQHAHRDVWVCAFSVGVGVMAAVLGDPPAVAEPDAEIAVQNAEDVADLPGAGDLPVPGVVAQEPGLSEHNGQEPGYGQLPP